MEKLYYTDKYRREFKADIEDIIERNGKYLVELNRTAFFPGGGGQSCDTGYIDDIKVIDMLEENGNVYHVLEEKPVNKSELNCKIDWDRREDGMHQHLGQHVLSGCFFTKYDFNTCSIHLGEDISTVDIKGKVTQEYAYEIEKMANEVIRQNMKVDSFVPDEKELNEMWTRRKLPDTEEEIRIVKIGDLDVNACCGCHPEYTGDLRMIKIKRIEKNKDATRIEFLAGKRAIDYALKRDEAMSSVCKRLSCGEENLEMCIENMEKHIESLSEKRKKLEEELSSYRIKELTSSAENINGIKVIKNIFREEDNKYLTRVVKSLVENEKTIVIFFNKSKESVNAVFACSEDIENINMSDTLKKSLGILDGRGGGKKIFAQGGGINNGKVDDALKIALDNIKENIK